MSLEHAILGFLNTKARSGYDLKTRCFDIEAKAFWTADQAQIYRTLERLRSDRLVAVKLRKQVGRPDRKVYEIAPAGREAFLQWLGAAVALPAPRDGFLLQVYFSGELSDTEISDLLGERRTAHQTRLEELRAEAIELAQDDSVAPRISAMRQAACDGAIATERATIDWLDDTMEAISEGHLPSSEISDPGTQKTLFGWAQA